MPMPDQAPAAEEEAAEPAQDQAAEAAAEEEKDYKALYEEALAQSRFDYQSVRHCSKTQSEFLSRLGRFDYQSVRHCSKTYGAKSLLRGDGKTDWSRLSILKKILINSVFSLMLIAVIVLLIFKQNNMSSRIKNVLIEQFELIFRQKSFKVHKN